MRFYMLEDESRFVVSPGRLDAPTNIPAFEFGDVLPIELQMFRRSLVNPANLYNVDLSAYQVTFNIGKPNMRPLLGFWTLTTTKGTSKPIASRASCEEVAAALLPAFGQTFVVGGSGSYIVTLLQNGVWALPTTSFLGSTLSQVIVMEITPGTVDTPAQYRVEVLEVAPARVAPNQWAAGNVTVNNVVTGSGNLWEIMLDPNATVGFYSLTVDGATTPLISLYGPITAIEQALAIAGKGASVQSSGDGGFLLAFANPVGTLTVNNHLGILPFITGNCSLSTTGVREMLDGCDWVTAELQVLVARNGTVVTSATAPVVIKMPVNQPEVIAIDSPSQSGLAFTINGDGAYLNVFQNGVEVAQAALNQATPNQIYPFPYSGVSFTISDDGNYMNIFKNNAQIGQIPLITQ